MRGKAKHSAGKDARIYERLATAAPLVEPSCIPPCSPPDLGDAVPAAETTDAGTSAARLADASCGMVSRRRHAAMSKGSPKELEDELSIIRRNNIRITGAGSRPMIFAHGFGCDQNMWRFVCPAFEDDFKIVLFDHVGAGRSDPTAYTSEKYASLSGYAQDVVEIGRELELHGAVFVGHSVSAMIGVLASLEAPEMFESLVLVGPSPRYIDDADYTGGFTRDQIEELLDSLADNPMGWSLAMAPAIMANSDRPELAEELANSFCRTDPDIAKEFARVTFMSDNRADLPNVTVPTLIIQCREDIIASEEVGSYVHRHLANSRLEILDATGHCPNLSAPGEVIAAIRAFV